VIWGGIHGTALALERYYRNNAVFRWIPAFLQTAFTFFIVVFAWVFFRAKDWPSALAYCSRMAGWGESSDGAALLGGIICQPYYLGSFLLAALVVWMGPQTWDWTRVLTSGKVVVLVALFWLSIIVMTTQAYNPFIYFIF
jgi:alginate O-acetyltransferase complex protein AlgI